MSDEDEKEQFGTDETCPNCGEKGVPFGAYILQVLAEAASVSIDNQKLREYASELRRNVLANPAQYPQIARFLVEDHQEKV